MNLIKTKLFAVMILFIVTSCASQSVPQKLDDFVNKVEQNSSAYSQSDWEKTAMEYQRLVDEYLYSEIEYTEEERNKAARAMGRYHAIILKNEIESSVSFLKEFCKIFPEYLDGFASGLNEDKLDDSNVELSMDAIDRAIEELFAVA